MGADYSFELISIDTYAPQFIGHHKQREGHSVRAYLDTFQMTLHITMKFSQVEKSRFEIVSPGGTWFALLCRKEGC